MLNRHERTHQQDTLAIERKFGQRAPTGVLMLAVVGCSQPAGDGQEEHLEFTSDGMQSPSPPGPDPTATDTGQTDSEQTEVSETDVPAPSVPVTALPAPTPAPEPEPAPVEPEIPPDPSIEAIDVTAPWGTELELSGVGLSRYGNEELSLTVGELDITPDDDDWVSVWTDDHIVIRVPFPHQGDITFSSSRGNVAGGSFTSEWQLAEALPLLDGISAVASISLDVGSIMLALDTQPMTIAHFDGVTWTTTELPEADVRLETFQLYSADGGTVSAFAATDDSPSRIVVFDGADGWALTELSYDIEGAVVTAGGLGGATIWFESSLGWQLIRNDGNDWESVGVPVTQPSGLSDATPVAVLGGSLFIVHAVDTGNFLDDHETPYYRALAPNAVEFEDRVRFGVAMDDYLTSIDATSRGRGFVVDYCGSDGDPTGLTGTSSRCRGGAYSPLGDPLPRGPRPSAWAKYAFTDYLIGVAYCEGDAQTRIAAHYEADAGNVLTWPCVPIAGLEIDSSGGWVPVVQHDGAWMPLTTDYHMATDPLSIQDAGVTPVDAGDAGADGG